MYTSCHGPRLREGTLLALVFVLLSALAGGAVRADDVAAFQKDLRAQNAKHLKAVTPGLAPATGSMIDAGYREGPDQGPWSLREGNLSITVELKRTAPIDLSAFPEPVLTVSVSGKPLLTVTGSQGQPEFVSFIAQLVEMDPGNPYPEVVFSTYTGGAHCCSDTRILTSSKDGKSWSEIEAGEFDGAPLTARDIDGDGRFEIAVRDNAFLYTFGCYACSAAPLQILRVEDGKVIDASALEEFSQAHQESLVNMIQYYDGGSAESNGFLAGYVAQKIRLGEGAEAWKFMMKYYDRKSDWGLEYCSVEEDAQGNCPGRKLRLAFPEALERFLDAAGYPLPN